MTWTSRRLLLTSTRKGSTCFPSITGRPVDSAAIGTNNSRSSLAFNSRPNATFQPSFRAEPRRRAAHGLDNREVRLRRELGHSQVVIARKLREQATCQDERGFCLPLEFFGARQSEPAAHCGRLPSGRAGEEHEPDAAMDGKDREAIVESRDLVDVRAIEEVPSQRRSAGVADETRRHDESDATTRPARVEAHARQRADRG